jgi:tetratricopeptide (TPR) repeat protein
LLLKEFHVHISQALLISPSPSSKSPNLTKPDFNMSAHFHTSPNTTLGGNANVALRRHNPYSPVGAFHASRAAEWHPDPDGVYAANASPPHRSASHSSQDDPAKRVATGLHTPAESDETVHDAPYTSEFSPAEAYYGFPDVPYTAMLYASLAPAWPSPPQYSQALADLERDQSVPSKGDDDEVAKPPATNNKIERKRRQRKRRLARRKERIRALKAALKDGTVPAGMPADDSTSESSSEEDSESDESSDDPDAREIPILPKSAEPSQAPTPARRSPLPRSPVTGSPAIPLPRSARLSHAFPAAPPVVVSCDADSPSHVVDCAAKRLSSKKPSKAHTDWHVVGGKNVAPTSSKPAKPADGETANQNPFAVLAHKSAPPKARNDEQRKDTSDGHSTLPTGTAAVLPESRKRSPQPQKRSCSKEKPKAPPVNFDAFLQQLTQATERAQPGIVAGVEMSVLDEVRGMAKRNKLALCVAKALCRADARRNRPLERYAELEALEEHVRNVACPPRLRALCHLELADACAEVQDADMSLRHATMAAEIAHTLHDLELSAKATLRIAKAHEVNGDSHQAMSSISQAFAMHPQPGPRFIIDAFTCYASAADLVGLIHVATRLFDRAAEIASSIGDRRLRADVLNHQSGSLIGRGAFNEAVVQLTSLLESSHDREHLFVTRCVMQLAQALFITGSNDWQSLLLMHAEAMKPVDDVSAGTLFGLLGQLHRADRDVKKSLAYHLNELHVMPTGQYRTCEVLNNIGQAYTLMGKHAMARQQHELELNQARMARDLNAEAKALITTGFNALAEGDSADALKFAKAAMTVVGRVSSADRERYNTRVGCWEVEWKALDLAEAVFIRNRKFAQAFQVADRKHVAELHNLILGRDESQLGNALKSSDMIERCASAGVNFIISYSIAWNDAATHMQVYAVDTHNAAVTCIAIPFPQRTMALLAAESSCFRKLVSGGEADAIMMPHHLNRLLEVASREQFSQLLALDAPSATGGLPQEWLTAFYDDLIAPVESSIRACQQSLGRTDLSLLVVADGLLSAVPFHALRPDAASPYMIDQFVMTTAPSVTLFLAVQASAPSKRRVARVPEVPTLREAAAEISAARMCDVAAVEWQLVRETKDPFIGAFTLSRDRELAAHELSNILAAAQTKQTKSLHEILRIISPLTHRVSSTAILTRLNCASNRIAHDVSVPPHVIFHLLGFGRTVRALFNPSALSRLETQTWSTDVPSARGFRDVCRSLLNAGDESWHSYLLCGAL